VRRANPDGRHAGTAPTAKAARVGEQHQRAERRLAAGSGDAKRADGKAREEDVGAPENVDGQFLRQDQIAHVENQKQRLKRFACGVRCAAAADEPPQPRLRRRFIDVLSIKDILLLLSSNSCCRRC